jgi:hypothetical protein
MSCLHHTNHSTFVHSLDPAHEELELDDQAEQAQAEETNPELEKGKPRCITPQSLTFILNHYLYVKIDCALSCRS